MSDAKNEIDVILHSDRKVRVGFTKAALDLIEALQVYSIESRIHPRNHVGFSEIAEVYEYSYMSNLFDLIKHTEWNNPHVSREYFEMVSLPVLQGFVDRVVGFKVFEATVGWSLASDFFNVAPKDSLDSGIQLVDGKVMIWFVKYGVGRFAVELKDLSDESANELGFLCDPIVYEKEKETIELSRRGIYPIADVAVNRWDHYYDCSLSTTSKERAQRERNLLRQWKRHDSDVLPQKIIRVNLIEMPSALDGNFMDCRSRDRQPISAAS